MKDEIDVETTKMLLRSVYGIERLLSSYGIYVHDSRPIMPTLINFMNVMNCLIDNKISVHGIKPEEIYRRVRYVVAREFKDPNLRRVKDFEEALKHTASEILVSSGFPRGTKAAVQLDFTVDEWE